MSRHVAPAPEVVAYVNSKYAERGQATILAERANLTMGSLRRVANGEPVAPDTVKRIARLMAREQAKEAPTPPTETTTALVAPTKRGRKGGELAIISPLAAIIGAHPEPEDEVMLRVSRMGQALVDSVQFCVLSMNQFVTEELRTLQRRRTKASSRAG